MQAFRELFGAAPQEAPRAQPIPTRADPAVEARRRAALARERAQSGRASTLLAGADRAAGEPVLTQKKLLGA